MDALYYAPFDSDTSACGEKVVQEKQRGIDARRNVEQLPKAVLSLHVSDFLSTILNDNADDINSNKPFDTRFMSKNILWPWGRLALYLVQEVVC